MLLKHNANFCINVTLIRLNILSTGAVSSLFCTGLHTLKTLLLEYRFAALYPPVQIRTIAASLQAVKDITESLDHLKHAALFIDLPKAFSTGDHFIMKQHLLSICCLIRLLADSKCGEGFSEAASLA